MNKILVALTLSFILSLGCAILADASGNIVFIDSAEEGQDWHIYTMASDGTKVKCLTKKPGLYEHPRWSPDGKKIAFATDGRIVIMELQTREIALLVEDGFTPVWSPEGWKR